MVAVSTRWIGVVESGLSKPDSDMGESEVATFVPH